jgi:hypothetical protein
VSVHLADRTIGLAKEVRVRATRLLLAIGLSGLVALATGCRTPPPPRIQIPIDTQGNDYTTYQHDPVKPLPPSATQAVDDPNAPPPPQSRAPQQPLQAPAVSQAYIESYDRVGRPRLLVLVDRAAQTPRAIVPGDYDTLERVIRDALAAQGHVAVVPADATRQINDEQRKALAANDTKALADVGQQFRADVIVQVKVPSTAAAEREETQITATARNARDAAQIATAAAAIPPPPQRRQIDFAGRLLAERLIDELAGAWENLARIPPTPASTQPAPATQPPRPGLSG